ncbi:hypothetical protein [Paenibacillus sp. NAIST15-1]|uniref:hypothetical protein n=1 Tax=Paenibacillus sp. NAIST15-1 TaxID=1605994 RepID=UPI00086B3101|nr:hypothetical protein [Paenibacillus sp. NAIST15-1]GAV11432.1 hypothetical protein PBN151_1361 [Paenibacillus sp. NAIST15-1]
MERKKIEFWTYGYENGSIVICFDKGQKYIELSPKDVKSMASWIMMENGTYIPNWNADLIN